MRGAWVDTLEMRSVELSSGRKGPHLSHSARLTRSLTCRSLENRQIKGSAQCNRLPYLFTGPGRSNNRRRLGPRSGHSGATGGTGSQCCASGYAQLEWGRAGQEVREELRLCPNRRKWGHFTFPPRHQPGDPWVPPFCRLLSV